MQDNSLIWVEISQAALTHNLKVLRGLVGADVKLAPMVKSHAYGHGLTEVAQVLRKAGADYLSVNALFEARKLRLAGDEQPIYICGYTALVDLREAVELDCELVIYNLVTLTKLSEVAIELKKTARVHLKVETGMYRQGVAASEAVAFADEIKKTSHVELVGVSTHFANIEDTTDHTYAKYQLTEFKKIKQAFEKTGHTALLWHAANSAATLLWSETHYDFTRVGIVVYGMWPFDGTFTSLTTERQGKIILKPVLTWKTRIAQIKTVPAGAKVGYDCTWEAERETRLAILPIGYYDGYVRAYSDKAQVLVRGRRAPVIGRVCMNICMVDVTDIPDVVLEDEVVLLGQQGEDEITAEELGDWSGTINYEVTTRIRDGIVRKVV